MKPSGESSERACDGAESGSLQEKWKEVEEISEWRMADVGLSDERRTLIRGSLEICGCGVLGIRGHKRV